MRRLALLALALLGAAVSGLPASGTRSDLSRATTDRPDDVIGSQIHIVYVVPSDGTDHELDTNGSITASVNAWNNWLASQTDNKGGFRLDTSGGMPDITFFRDSRSTATIAARGAFVREQLESDLHAAGINAPQKIYAVYYDGVSNNTCGSGAWPPTITGNVGAIMLHGLPDQPTPCDHNTLAPNGGPGYFEFSMVHEILHTLGFVPTCAPHQTAAGHVSDAANDLMWSGISPWQLPPTLDVGHDDYFEAGRAGCLDFANSLYLQANAPAAQPVTTAAVTTTAKSTTTVNLGTGVHPRSCTPPHGPGDAHIHSRNLDVTSISCSVGRNVALACVKFTYGKKGTCKAAGFSWRCTSNRVAKGSYSEQSCRAGVTRLMTILWTD